MDVAQFGDVFHALGDPDAEVYLFLIRDLHCPAALEDLEQRPLRAVLQVHPWAWVIGCRHGQARCRGRDESEMGQWSQLGLSRVTTKTDESETASRMQRNAVAPDPKGPCCKRAARA